MKNNKFHFHKTIYGLTSIPIYNTIFGKIHYHDTFLGPTTKNKDKNGHTYKLKIKTETDKWIDLP